jgi:hypothetical protein
MILGLLIRPSEIVELIIAWHARQFFSVFRGLWLVVILWIPWSILIDYISLLKTRVILRLLTSLSQHGAGTQRYLTRFLVRREYTANGEPRASCGSEVDELSWLMRQPKSTNSGTGTIAGEDLDRAAPWRSPRRSPVSEDVARVGRFGPGNRAILVANAKVRATAPRFSLNSC